MSDKVVKISTIMPVYNASKFLKQSIESVLNQTFKDIELICVDDGSTDNSLQIIEDYAKKDNRIKIVKQKNLTAGAARNNGLQYARGEFVHYFDADDWIKLNCYEILWDKVKDSDVDFCVFQFSTFNQVTKEFKYSPHKMINVDQVTSFKEFPKFFLYNAVVPWNKIVRRKFILDNNLKYDEIVCANDRSFYFKLLTASKKIKIIPDCLLFYRINNLNSLVGDTRSKNFDCHFKSFESTYEVYKNQPVEIQKMFIDITIKDFLNFFKRSDDKYKLQIFVQLYNYFHTMDLSVFGEDLKPYSWNPDYQKIMKCKFLLRDVDYDEKQELVIKDLSTAIKAKNDYQNLSNRYKNELMLTKKSFSFKLGRFLTIPVRGIRKVFKVFKNNGFVGTFKKINTLRKAYAEKQKEKRLSKSKAVISKWKRRKEPVIISFTSFPARIKTVHLVVDSLFKQTIKPDRIILWLAESQFPRKEKELPKELLAQKKRGLEIRWCEDIRSYKKLIPALKLFPNAVIVTIDDDNVFDKDWLKILYSAYLNNPNCIVCHRITKFVLNEEDEFEIITSGRQYYHQPSFLNKLVGAGGVLYPPHSLYKDITNQDLFMSLAPTNDDQWFWFMGILNGFRVKVADGAQIKLNPISGTQEVALSNINDHGENLFWKQFNELIKYYPKVKDVLKQEYYRTAIYYVNKDNFPDNVDEIRANRSDYKYKFYKSVDEKDLEKEIEFWWDFGRKNEHLDINKPQSLSQKIQWLKLYDSTILKSHLTDKWLAKEYVKSLLGEQYIIKTLGVYKKFEDINFNKLPKQFVIKSTHGSGQIEIVRDKNLINKRELKEKINSWLETDYANRAGFELHYHNIYPRIIIEELVEGINNDLYDYKIMCFNGKPEFVWVDTDRFTSHKRTLFNLNWEQLSVKYQYEISKNKIPRPKQLKKLLHFSEILSKPFILSRCDFYILKNGNIKFGEITFTSGSGTDKFEPLTFDYDLGKKIILPEKTKFKKLSKEQILASEKEFLNGLKRNKSKWIKR